MAIGRMVFRTLQAISSNQAARWAELLFFTPPRSRLAPWQRDTLVRARPSTLDVDGRRVGIWSWGRSGEPVVVLVHGWGSRGGRLAAFVWPLVAAGYRVVAFDAPGHGASDGRLSSMPQFARALRAVTDAEGPAHGIIAHSMGASATTLALQSGLPVGRAVFVAPAADPPGMMIRVAAGFGLTAGTIARIKARSERRLNVRWDDLRVPGMAARMQAPLLVIHDRDDAVVPWTDGAAIAAAWPGAELVSTDGLGHREIIRAPSVVQRAVEFVTGTAAAAVTPSAEAELLERELFHRDARVAARRVTA